MSARRVVITGACGNLGTKLTIHLLSENAPYHLVCIDVQPHKIPQKLLDESNTTYEFHTINVNTYTQTLQNLFQNAYCIVHLAVYPNLRATWDQTMISIDMVYSVFQAGVKAGVHRIIYASSNHAAGGYWNDPNVKENELTTNLSYKPGTKYNFWGSNGLDSTIYGCMKLFAERYGAMLVQSNQLPSFIAMRIGANFPGKDGNEKHNIEKSINEEIFYDGKDETGFVLKHSNDIIGPHNPDDVKKWLFNMWISDDDWKRYMMAALQCDHIGNDVINVVSNNTGMKWNLDNTIKILNVIPKDNFWK